MTSLNILLAVILLFINVFFIIRAWCGHINITHPILLFSLTVLLVEFPMLVSMFRFYDTNLLPRLLVCMITCQLALYFGYESKHTQSSITYCLDFVNNDFRLLTLILVMIGLIPIFYYHKMESVYGGINVVMGFLRTFGVIGLIISAEKILEGRKIFLWIVLLILAYLPLLYYGYAVKGSRATMFGLTFLTFIYLTEAFPRYKKTIIRFFIVFFCVGCIVGASITNIRRVNNYKQEDAISLTEINYLRTFFEAFSASDNPHGMDLANGAMGMKYVEENLAYDYGLVYWNTFVYNFIPKRIIGEDAKQMYYLGTQSMKERDSYVEKLTHGITTRTGFYYAFANFGYLGFIAFFFIGWLLCKYSIMANFSFFYKILWIKCTMEIPVMITHSLQNLFGAIEFFFLFLVPIFICFSLRRCHYYEESEE